MNYKNILKVSVAVLASLAVLAGCAKKEEFKEITELVLSRCLEPQNLTARVDVATGDIVTFGWDVNKDAQIYELSLYTDAERTQLEKTWELEAAQIPFSVRLTADQKYWYTVSAFKADAEGVRIESSQSKLAVFDSDGGIKTYAVKDNLFLEVSGRTATSLTLAWSSEVEDYREVTELRAVPVSGGSSVTKELTDAESIAAAATIEGLVASTEYQVTLFYMSASRGAVDTWTVAEQGEKVAVSTSADLVTAVNAGGSYYLTYSDAVYSMSTAKPVASLTVVGELSADGKKPAVQGSIDISSILASGSSLRFENIHFADNGNTGHLITFSAGPLTMDKIEFVNCEITGFKSGLFYNNKDGGLTIGEVSFDSCDIHDILGSGGDGIDIRKPTDIPSFKFVNCTIYDGFRTFVRLDANDAIKIGNIDFENNTVKNIATMVDGNNRGIFAFRTATSITLKNNLFLWENSGQTGLDANQRPNDKAQLFQSNAASVKPTITASGNYAYAHGDGFFFEVDAATAGFKDMNVDPCYNSKGNFFQLAAQDLITGKVGASKWWISYVEKPEDLTQNVLPGAHVWNLQDASLFAGEVKNSRVRDELMLVGTEATPLNADGAINFEKATVLSKKGVPEEGYLSFKVNTPGSVDMLVAKGGASSVVVALYDDNGFAVQGGIMTPYVAGVQKVVIPKVTGEGTVYIYAAGAITLSKLAWSLDAEGGDMRLSTPKVTVEPVTVMEGDANEVGISWEPIAHAASYQVSFNNRKQDPQTETTFTVSADDIAALKAGLYTFTVRAFPEEGDIYYQQSELGIASFAIQPKGGDVPAEVTLTWDISSASWQDALEASAPTAKGTNQASWTVSVDGLTYTSGSGNGKWDVDYIQPNGAGDKTKRVFTFEAPADGKLVITAYSAKSGEARGIAVVDVRDTEDVLTVDAEASLEYDVKAGMVYVYPKAGVRFLKLEFTYTQAKIEKDWDISSASWQDALEASAPTAKGTNQASWTVSVDGLTYTSGSGNGKWDVDYIQPNGAGDKTKRVFTFEAPADGKLVITAYSAKSGEARGIAVVDVRDTEDVLTVDAEASLEYDVKAGMVYIYPKAGVRFMKFHYSN